MPDEKYIFRTLFPVEFQKALVAKECDQAMLQRSMAKRGHRITKQFLNMMAQGKRRVPGHQLQKISEALGLDEVARRRLHRAAAMDAGYDVGGVDG